MYARELAWTRCEQSQLLFLHVHIVPVWRRQQTEEQMASHELNSQASRQHQAYSHVDESCAVAQQKLVFLLRGQRAVCLRLLVGGRQGGVHDSEQ